ncbi:hypothetical protein NECID01_1433 [Nematocida sp. AWRm77]|nr:hypothetical protein NECID01_1433 [Nematocida sp. AWRm77]
MAERNRKVHPQRVERRREELVRLKKEAEEIDAQLDRAKQAVSELRKSADQSVRHGTVDLDLLLRRVILGGATKQVRASYASLGTERRGEGCSSPNGVLSARVPGSKRPSTEFVPGMMMTQAEAKTLCSVSFVNTALLREYPNIEELLNRAQKE